MDDKNSFVKKKKRKKKKGSFLASDVRAIKSIAAAAGIYPKGSEERQAEDLGTPPPPTDRHTHTRQSGTAASFHSAESSRTRGADKSETIH